MAALLVGLLAPFDEDLVGSHHPAADATGAAPLTLRDTLFGDLALPHWPPAGAPVGDAPWSSFAAARHHLEAGDPGAARARWREVLALPGLDTRHYLQAWSFLRAQGDRPPEAQAKQVHGVVLEVALAEGLDLLAAYDDHSARYYNYSGAGVVWERPDASLDGCIDRLLTHSVAVVQRIGPWLEPRRPAPPAGQVRINFLTPSGLYFGEGTMEALMGYPVAVPVLNGAIELMQQLVDRQAA
ncbi:MAG: hypothetical protein IPI92_01360 [Gemmatimonadetes bacterium]|nr:hypothetical protein [Gemmatimonadota bacterium]MBK7783130.1 hypothetical protein [Gemmatimonadota bacterium]